MTRLDRRVEVAKLMQIINEEHKETLEALADSERKDREHTLEMAEHVWQKVKGYPIPESYSEEDRLSIFERYYHRASAQSQGE
jgi:5-methylcytosine-specific restriction endonuclease McrBC GTP-binding regulatory subunit McrB